MNQVAVAKFNFRMLLPAGFIACKEIQLANETYLIYIYVEESSRKFIQMRITNCYNFLRAQVNYEDVLNCVQTAEVAQGYDIIKPIQQAIVNLEFKYKEDCDELILKMSKPLTIKFTKLSSGQADYLKPILFGMASHISQLQGSTSPMKHGYTNIETIPQLRVRQGNSKRKKKPMGMSLLNPTSRKIETKHGVEFDD